MDLPEAVQHDCERDMRAASRGALTCKKRARHVTVAAVAAAVHYKHLSIHLSRN